MAGDQSSGQAFQQFRASSTHQPVDADDFSSAHIQRQFVDKLLVKVNGRLSELSEAIQRTVEETIVSKIGTMTQQWNNKPKLVLNSDLDAELKWVAKRLADDAVAKVKESMQWTIEQLVAKEVEHRLNETVIRHVREAVEKKVANVLSKE